MGRRRRNNPDDNGAIGCAFIIMLAVIAMPIVGLYMIAQGNKNGDDEEKLIGILLTVMGVILWIYLAVQ